MKISKELVSITICYSLFIQIITTGISLDGFNKKIDKKDSVLKEILALETVVQIVEGMVYLWISYSINNLSKMLDRRYMDWAITTPLMLLSTIVFMKYNEHREKNKKSITFMGFLKDNQNIIIQIFVLNSIMLFFGYLGEKRIMNKEISMFIGFIFFFWVFKLIYDKYVNGILINKGLYCFVFIIWALYGVSATFNKELKHTSYNILDVIAKNFYGLYIYYKILQITKT